MRETQILRGLHKARAKMGNNLAAGYAPRDLRRGAVNLKGPGTTTSDSIHGVSLSKGESVLPAKTTAAIGPANIARVIEKTNGKAPARGLRTGGHHATGVIPGMVDQLAPKAGSSVVSDMADQLRTNAPKAPATAGLRPTNPLPTTAAAAYNASPEGVASAQSFQQQRGFAPRGMPAPAPNVTPTLGAAPVAEAPKPTGLWNQVKHYGGKAVGAAGDAAASVKGAPTNGLKALGKLGLAAAPVVGAAGAVMDSDASVKSLADSTGLDYGSDAGRMGANVINFLDKTGNAATFGLAGKLGTALSSKMNGGSFFGAPAPATQATSATQPAAVPAPAPANPHAEANAAKLDGAAPINVERQPNGVMSFSNTADTGQNNYTGSGAAGLRRGNMNVIPAFTGGGAGTSDADLAVMRANLRDGVDLSRGTSQQRAPDNSPQGLIMQRIQSGLGSGQTLTAAGVAALQALNTTDKNYKANMFGHEISRDNSVRGNQVTREGNELQYQGGLNRLKFDMQQKGLDRQEQGAKSLDEFVKSDPSTFVDDPKNPGGPKVHDPSRAAALSKYMAETVPGISDGQGGSMSLQQAFAVNNPAARDAAQKSSNEMALREFANKYSKDAPLGKGTDAGRLVIKGAPRPSELADLAKNMHATDYIATKLPWINSQTVEVGGLGGRSIAVPLKDVISAPNGREMLEALSRLSASK